MRNFPRLWISRAPFDKALEGFSEPHRLTHNRLLFLITRD